MSKYLGRIITDQAPAGYSVYFDGTGDYLTVPANAAFNFGTGDFTVEFWLYFQNLTGFQTIFDISYTTSPNLLFQASSGAMAVYMNGGSTVLAASAVSNGTWNHFALVRSGTTVTLYLNGVSVSSATYSGNVGNSTSIVYVGGSLGGSGFYLNGYLSNVRVVKGTALYTAAFTPPTQLFPITNTSLLTCQSPSIIDNSSNAFAITTNGNAAVSTFTPFPAYNPAPTSSNPLTPAPGVWTLDEALQYTQQGVWPSYAANAIEDVFSTYLYTGTGASQTITNGIDLSTKGGLVWTKARNTTFRHGLQDTVRGVGKLLSSNNTLAEQSDPTSITSFNTNGFSLGADSLYASCNNSGSSYVSWTFREQAKFFDIVTYTGNNAGQTLNHNLGSTPGFIYIKCRSAAGEIGAVYHRSLGTSNYLIMEQTAAAQSSTGFWGTPTSTTFFVPSSMSANGATYVAYLFAHDAGGFGAAGTDNVISCGSFTSDGSGNATIDLGYEPQWILLKTTGVADAWYLYDTMRGITSKDAAGNAFNAYVSPNSANAETTTTGGPWSVNQTGFQYSGGFSSRAFIYIAIRRGPMRPPTTGTSVFFPLAVAQADTPNSSGVPFPPDLVNTFSRNGNDRTSGFTQFQFLDRLRSLGIPVTTYNSSTGVNAVQLISSSNAAENAGMNVAYVALLADSQNITRGSGWNSASYGNWLNYFWRRAPGFLDVVCYTGTGANRTVSHNLTIPPELMIVKRRDAAGSWQVYVNALGNTNYLVLDSNAPSVASSTRWNNTTPTASVFTVGTDATVNASGGTYVAYLFATVGGVSKVGSYTGTGTTQQINCGFTNGSRFVMIRRVDSGDDWFVWDSARGIVAGNDPYLRLNNPAAEITVTDYVDTYSLGFELSSTAPAGLNASGGTYIFLAIA